MEELKELLKRQNLLLGRILYAVGVSKDRADMARMFPGYSFAEDRGTNEAPHKYAMRDMSAALHKFLYEQPDKSWTGSAEELLRDLKDQKLFEPFTPQELGSMLGRLVKPVIMQLYRGVWTILGERITQSKPIRWSLRAASEDTYRRLNKADVTTHKVVVTPTVIRAPEPPAAG